MYELYPWQNKFIQNCDYKYRFQSNFYIHYNILICNFYGSLLKVYHQQNVRTGD